MAAQDVVGTSVAAPLACKLRVRYAECDPQGVVFNAHFLAYFDIAVTELFREAFGAMGGYQAIVDHGVELVVAEAGLRYRRPAHFDDELTIEIAIARLGTTSITTSHRVLRDGERLVEGTLRHVLVDLKKLVEHEPDAKATIPDWMRERLVPYLRSNPSRES
ncbi:MAG: acyl-CoA thioesterase [Solirubrobacteraceae bacterium]